MSTLETIAVREWSARFTPEDQFRAMTALEEGKVLFFPHLAFPLAAEERGFLTAGAAGGQRKNVSLDPATGRLSGGSASVNVQALAAMIERFGQQATALARALLPSYAPQLERARTSFRPVEARDRQQSPRHDDRLLHVDAFPTRPMRGRRILRFFTNVSPSNAPRVWRVGMPFAEFAHHFVPHLRAPLPGASAVLAALGLTKGRRSRYDALMLGLHDAGKKDAAWQCGSPQETVAFPAGSSWMCFTDSVLHAAMSGDGALEQTFHIPIAVMARPALAPLLVLEDLTGQRLV